MTQAEAEATTEAEAKRETQPVARVDLFQFQTLRVVFALNEIEIEMPTWLIRFSWCAFVKILIFENVAKSFLIFFSFELFVHN